MARNKLNGDAFRDQEAARLEREGYSTRTEVNIRTLWGLRRVDIPAWKRAVGLEIFETKLGTSFYGGMQEQKDIWIEEFLRIPVHVIRGF